MIFRNFARAYGANSLKLQGDVQNHSASLVSHVHICKSQCQSVRATSLRRALKCVGGYLLCNAPS